MATCFGYIIAILRPKKSIAQVHKGCTQWDLISFTFHVIYMNFSLLSKPVASFIRVTNFIALDCHLRS